MANINVECPHCQTNFETPDSLIGNEVLCPACGKNFVVKITPPPEENFSKVYSHTDVNGSSKHFTLKQTVGSSRIFKCLLGISLALSIAAFGLALMTSGLPKRKFVSEPEKAVRAHLTFQKEINSIGDYFWRKNGDKILKSLEIKEIKVNGNWAVAFYKLSLGATEVKQTMFLYKTNEGIWIQVSIYDAKKRCPERWFQALNEKIERFQKDSGEFDTFDL